MHFQWKTHPKLHATQLKELTQTQVHSLTLLDLNAHLDYPKTCKLQSFETICTLTSSPQNQK